MHTAQFVYFIFLGIFFAISGSKTLQSSNQPSVSNQQYSTESALNRQIHNGQLTRIKHIYIYLNQYFLLCLLSAFPTMHTGRQQFKDSWVQCSDFTKCSVSLFVDFPRVRQGVSFRLVFISLCCSASLCLFTSIKYVEICGNLGSPNFYVQLHIWESVVLTTDFENYWKYSKCIHGKWSEMKPWRGGKKGRISLNWILRNLSKKSACYNPLHRFSILSLLLSTA